MYFNREKYYDFRDVLILPKPSNLNSRKDVELETNFTFNNNRPYFPRQFINLFTIS